MIDDDHLRSWTILSFSVWAQGMVITIVVVTRLSPHELWQLWVPRSTKALIPSQLSELILGNEMCTNKPQWTIQIPKRAEAREVTLTLGNPWNLDVAAAAGKKLSCFATHISECRTKKMLSDAVRRKCKMQCSNASGLQVFVSPSYTKIFKFLQPFNPYHVWNGSSIAELSCYRVKR